MEKVTHTPGPWVIWRSNEDNSVNVSGLAREFVCQVGVPAGHDVAIINADARLIAAAPDLLEALKRTLSWLSSYPGGGALGAYDQARAAIERATTVSDRSESKTT